MLPTSKNWLLISTDCSVSLSFAVSINGGNLLKTNTHEFLLIFQIQFQIYNLPLYSFLPPPPTVVGMEPRAPWVGACCHRVMPLACWGRETLPYFLISLSLTANTSAVTCSPAMDNFCSCSQYTSVFIVCCMALSSEHTATESFMYSFYFYIFVVHAGQALCH